MSWRSPKPRRPSRWIPTMTPAYANRAFNQLRLNRLDDALLTVRRAAERKLESAPLLLIPYFVAFLKGTDDELARSAAVARKSPATEDIISHLEALALARSGQLRDARRMSAVAVEIAQRGGSTRTGRLVRSGQRRVGSVLRECGRRQAERHQGARARKGRSRSGLCRGVRAGPLR